MSDLTRCSCKRALSVICFVLVLFILLGLTNGGLLNSLFYMTYNATLLECFENGTRDCYTPDNLAVLRLSLTTSSIQSLMVLTLIFGIVFLYRLYLRYAGRNIYTTDLDPSFFSDGGERTTINSFGGIEVGEELLEIDEGKED